MSEHLVKLAGGMLILQFYADHDGKVGSCRFNSTTKFVCCNLLPVSSRVVLSVISGRTDWDSVAFENLVSCLDGYNVLPIDSKS